MKASNYNWLRRSTGLGLVLCAVAPWAMAQDAATVSLGSNGILFSAIAWGEGSTLRVSCSDGYYAEEQYEDTASISFTLPPVSGQCKYELRTHPFVDRDALEAAEAAGDEQRVRELAEAASQQVRVSNGSFEAVNGVIVPPQPGETALGAAQ